MLTAHSASHPVLPEKTQLVHLELQESRARGPLLTFVQEGPTAKGHTLLGTQSPPLAGCTGVSVGTALGPDAGLSVGRAYRGRRAYHPDQHTTENRR